MKGAFMKHHQHSRESGFTLVEIAIVMVVIGLLLGGVLKGQELIENAKVKNASNDISGVTTAYNAYIDRFRRLPGDDGPTLADLTARGGAWANVSAFGSNDGVLDITAANAFSPGGEEVAFWQHLRAAGFIAGNPADAGLAALPRNAFNGNTAVAVNTAAATGMPPNLSACMGQIPGKAARQMDAQLDDGNPTTGTFRATLGVIGTNTTPGAAAASYSDDQQYTVCAAI
jgi:prepilin-type N-terminal cleavage/methylation domain-containing protein